MNTCCLITMIYNMFLIGGKEFYPPGWADDGTDLGKKTKIKSYFKFRVSGPVFFILSGLRAQ